MTPRKVPAGALDPELHPTRDYTGLHWVHRVGSTDYVFPVHSVSRTKRGEIEIVYGGKGPMDALAPRVVCRDGDEVLIDTIVERKAEAELDEEPEAELGL